ncbi:MAG: SDR family NAD(P)-dependent oxidoreductase, partial [Gammaproteobacteria bacterium]|nr:SDR family NAD(P)-dependent oxidoreductase [Gammaproteobacteria bacterium]
MRDALKGLHFFTRFAYSFSALGYRQRRLFWNDQPGDFGGERWLVTGASGGIGRAITEGAAEQGGEVLAVARSKAKLAELTTDCGDAVTAAAVDLSKQKEIEALLDQLAESTSNSTIDVLVNNVGVLLNEHQLGDDGHELSFSTNLLNHYRLTNGLAERGLLADNAVVINMTSGGMYNVPLVVSKLNVLDAQAYDGVLAYAYQKRAQVVLNAWWREHYADRPWSFYVMHPGWVDTEGVK